jgi:hypothetical protein
MATDGKSVLVFQKINLAKIFVIGRPRLRWDSPPAKSRGISFEISIAAAFREGNGFAVTDAITAMCRP